ncbi:uncharacterized protein N7482_007890 [Penicillium canariense]|uniref:Uncharacterized protein n=1 Tax=Penicillium canariense TaxID=189055 RepID=A0A9W9HZX6_9EURO|nr:uncharacterized protein N7482_007890 [Penicillium canariense]KAJ5160886.1 hypothetical protein N7482_007890 [Penicillium canariense]
MAKPLNEERVEEYELLDEYYQVGLLEDDNECEEDNPILDGVESQAFGKLQFFNGQKWVWKEDTYIWSERSM